MIRTQIQLSQEQARSLRSQARRLGVSMAEVIRRCVDRGLAEEESNCRGLYEKAASLLGRFPDRSGAPDLAADHDRYLGEENA